MTVPERPRTQGQIPDVRPEGQDDSVSSRVGDLAERGRQIVGEAAREAQQKVGSTTVRAQRRIRCQALGTANRRRRTIVSQGRDLTRESEKVAEQLRNDGMDGPADLIEVASRELQDLVGYLDSTPVEGMLSDASMVVRQRPLAFLGAAFAVGFTTTRLLKADASDKELGGLDAPLAGAQFDLQGSTHAALK